MFDLLIKDIGVMATALGDKALKGENQKKVSFSEDLAIGVEKDKITFVGKNSEVKNTDSKKTVYAMNSLVTAGLVDSHTHLVFGGSREHEIPLKLNGASYIDILKSGGGILSTVKATRAMSKDELYQKALHTTRKMLLYGTTTLEAKSGYGLDYETELKQLEVIKELKEKSDIDIVATFMGAHAVPDEYKNDREKYIDLLCNDMLPKIAKLSFVKYSDIFCEEGVFSYEDSKRIMEAAKKNGFQLKIHADEIKPIGGSVLAGELKAISAEHLIEADDKGIDSMASGGTIAVLLPATSFYLGKNFARARDMINKNVPVAIASDYNPGSCPSFNLQFCMNLAYLKYRLTPAEALTAVTLNAASAIGMEKTVGTIEVGKQADIIIWDAKNLDYIFYRFGDNLVNTVIKKGIVL